MPGTVNCATDIDKPYKVDISGFFGEPIVSGGALLGQTRVKECFPEADEGERMFC